MGKRQGALVSFFVFALATVAAGQDGPPQTQAAPPLGTPTVSITSPADGTITNKTAVDVTVAYAAGPGRGNPHVTRIDLLLDGQLVASADIPARQGQAGTHNFSAVDISAIANTGTFGSLIARAFQGNARRGNSRDSSPVRILVDTISPIISGLTPPDRSATQNRRPELSANVRDEGGSELDPDSIRLILNGVILPAEPTFSDANTARAPSLELWKSAHLCEAYS
jgi:hypothetical protein